jgi:hypothetical protein
VKTSTHVQKARTTTGGMPDASTPGGARAIALAPPKYGVDFVDRGPANASPTPCLQGRFGRPMTKEPPEAASPHSLPGMTVMPNRTGLPDHLKAGVESLSGVDLSSVRVHYNSPKPARLNALAYAQGADIHLAPGEEEHLPHEAWHTAQQAQRRVRPTKQWKGATPLNDDTELEREADVMGARALAASGFDAIHHHEAAPSSGSAPPVIQRSVGFEAELSVPSFGPPPSSVDKARLATGPEGHEPTPAIEQFFFGGLPYGVDRGHNTNFTLKPDHNELQEKATAIRAKAKEMGFLLGDPERSTSNLEYVTPPLDELAAGSTARFNTQLSAIKDHAKTIFPGAKATLSAIGAPAADTYTGIPETDLQTWLGSRYKDVEALVTGFKDSVKNEFYLQATVGIIPSAIRDLHSRYTPKSGEEVKTKMRRAMLLATRYVDALVDSQGFQKLSYIKKMRQGDVVKSTSGDVTLPARPIDYEAFVGVLHLIFTYMVGSALNQTNLLDGSTAKNSIPFLSKMRNMRHIITKAAPSLQKNPPPEFLIGFIDSYFAKSPLTKVKFWVANGLQDRRGVKDREPTVDVTFVLSMLSDLDEPDLFDVSAVSSPRSFDEPDALPTEVSKASADQQGAQFEYRYITARPDADGLAAELMKVVDEVRTLNLKHVSADRRLHIIQTADA